MPDDSRDHLWHVVVVALGPKGIPMIKGFKDFLLRGNVIDLAVAFVIGVAFAAVITAFTENIIQPIINSVGGRESLGLGFFIRDNDQKTFVDIGAFITALITFVITAAAIYFFVVVPVKRLMERRNRGEEPQAEVPTEDIVLLREIRDSLQQRSI
jgi:large conductance mechanosensitive channel